jgi:hypothetical protein
MPPDSSEGNFRAVAFKPHQFEKLRDDGGALPTRRAGRLEGQFDVAVDRAPGQEGLAVVLKDDRDFGAWAEHRFAIIADLALRRGQKAGDEPEHRRLAAARSADNADELAFRNLEIDAGQHLLGAEGHSGVLKFQQSGHAAAPLAPISPCPG